MTNSSSEDLRQRAIAAVDQAEDLHVPVGLVQMGMLRSVDVDDGTATIGLALPCIACPAAQLMLDDVRERVRALDLFDRVVVAYSWDEPWKRADLSSRALEIMRETGVQA